MLIINVMNRFKSLKIFTVASHSSPADFFHELETDRFVHEWDKVRVVAEPGGAAAFGALLSAKYTPAPGERVAVVVCGANTTAVRFD